MLYHISNEMVRACLEALLQMNREGDVDGILSLVNALEEATEGPAGEILLSPSAQVGKAAVRTPS
jgi:hypothetical protein